MRLKITVIAILLSAVASAQQVPMYSQYLFHDYLINPAVAGTRDYYDAKMTYRLQWVGMEDAPRTMAISSNGPLKNRKMGIGGYFINDVAGHVYQRKGGLTYSYILSLSDGIKMSFGLSGGVIGFTVDGTKLNLNQSGDQVLSNLVQTYYGADGAFGFLLYSERFRLGFSINQLFANKLEFFSEGNIGTARLSQHYNIHASYEIGNEDAKFSYTPYILLKYVNPAPLQFDVGLKVEYMDAFWLGAAYRNKEAFSILLGATIRDNIVIGYSYDVVSSDINVRVNASHEIMIGLKMNRALPPKKK